MALSGGGEELIPHAWIGQEVVVALLEPGQSLKLFGKEPGIR